MSKYLGYVIFIFLFLSSSFSFAQSVGGIPSSGPSSDPELYQEYCPYEVGSEQYDECMSCIYDCEALDGGFIERCACKCGGGISLNTNVPFVGSCIMMQGSSNQSSGAQNAGTTVNQITAFPLLIGGLSRILVTAILVFSFVMIIVGGVMMTMEGANEEQYNKGKSYIRHVVIALMLLGASGLILRLINPNFFG